MQPWYVLVRFDAEVEGDPRRRAERERDWPAGYPVTVSVDKEKLEGLALSNSTSKCWWKVVAAKPS